MTTGIFSAMNIIGLLAFALVGAFKGIKHELDVLGVTILGIVTALGGGTTRDLLVNRVPYALQTTTDMTVALIGVLLAFIGVRIHTNLESHTLVLILDAIGLAAFATTGALVGHSTGISPFGIVILAMVTGVGGGAIAELLLNTTPFVLTDDFYATCALLGGITFWLIVSLGLTPQPAAVGCAITTLAMRLAALTRNWELPTVQLQHS